MWVPLSLLAVLVVKANAYTKYTNGDALLVYQKFKDYMISPQVIQSPPVYMLKIIFGEYNVYFGNFIPLCATNAPPSLSFPTQSRNYLHTLIICDLDYPEVGADNGTQAVYGLVVNSPGPNLQQGDTIVPFIAPNPLPGSGPSRFLVLIYRQKNPIPVTNELFISFAENKYKNFILSEFVAECNLGDPIAGNFFRVRQTFCECLCEEKTYCNCCDDNDDCPSQGLCTTSQCTTCDSNGNSVNIN